MWELGAVLIDELKRRASCETPREIKINQRKRQKRKKEIRVRKRKKFSVRRKIQPDTGGIRNHNQPTTSKRKIEESAAPNANEIAETRH